MASPTRARDGLEVTLTGQNFQGPTRTEDDRARPTLNAPSPSPSLGGHDDIAAFDVQRQQAPQSSKKFPFFIRGGQRYHLSTMIAGTEIYHTFTLEQWEKIADKMDALRNHNEVLNGIDLSEFSVNLSTESFTAIEQGQNESFEHASFSPTHPAYETFEALSKHAQDLLPSTITPISFESAYVSRGSERKAFSGKAKKDKEKILSMKPEKASEFISKHISPMMSSIQEFGSYGIDRSSSDDEINAVYYQCQALFRDMEAKLDVYEAASNTHIPLEEKLEEKLQEATENLAIAKEATPQDARDINRIETHIKGLKLKILACGYKEQMRLAAALFNPGAPDLTATSADEVNYNAKDSGLTQSILQNAFDARLVLCHTEGLIDDQGRVLSSMTAEQKAKYEQITDTAALLIPDITSQSVGARSESDHLIQLFYGGGSALNAFAKRPTQRLQDDQAPIYSAFPSVAPPEKQSASVHETMRQMLQQVIYS